MGAQQQPGWMFAVETRGQAQFAPPRDDAQQVALANAQSRGVLRVDLQDRAGVELVEARDLTRFCPGMPLVGAPAR